MRIANYEMDVERPRAAWGQGPVPRRFPSEWEDESGIPLGASSGTAIRFVVEGKRGEGAEFLQATVPMTKRDWDVTSPIARERAAFAKLGEDELRDHRAYYKLCAQWFINPRRNTAALCIYRPRATERWLASGGLVGHAD